MMIMLTRWMILFGFYDDEEDDENHWGCEDVNEDEVDDPDDES